MDAVLGTKSLSAAQKGILLRHTLHSNQSFLNVGGYAFVKGSLDLDRLAYAIRFVLNGADVLALLSTADVIPSAIEYDVASNVMVLGSEAACKEWMQKDIQVPIVEQRLVFYARVLQCAPDTFFWYVKTHHILFDGYSMALFFNKVSDIYNNHGEERDAGLKSFISFIQQEHVYEQSAAFQNDREFWTEKVKGLSDGNMFLSLANPTRSKTLTSVRKELAFSRERFSQLQEFCDRHNVTVAHLLIAVLLYLNRSLNNGAGVLGIPVFNRPGNDEKQTLGACMNVIPLFLDIAHIETFAALVTAVRNELKVTVKHQRYELFNILDVLRTDGSFFNVTFSHQKNTYNGKLGNADVAITFMHNGSQQEDLAVHLLEYSDTRPVVLSFDYRVDVFSETQVELLMDSFSEILDQALSTDVSLKDLAIVNEAEAAKLLDSFNRRPDKYTPADNVLTQFTAWTEATPAAPAIVYQDTTYNYHDLNNIADAICTWLRIEHGIRKGDRIGLKTDRTPFSIAAIVGILKAGAVYVPISPDYPEERIAYIVEDSSCKLLIDNDSLQQFDQATFTNRHNDDILIADSDLAYIMYTSGSTGRPKGVMVTHGNVGAFVNALPDSFGFRPGWRIASLTSLTFDISILELLGAICNGLSIVLMEAKDPVLVSSRLSAGEVDVLQLTPSRLQQLLNGGMDTQVLNQLKVMLVGGEALPPHLYELLKQQDTRVYNVYGPTETTIWSSSLLLNDSETLSIGRPLPDEQLYILNTYDQLCPVGIPGEICIGGAGVARGYLNLEGLTAEKFIADPFSGISGSRLYRTGDIGYWREDGTIMYVGRRDQQVKVRGYRIELGEIESVLQQYEGISQCAVLATSDNTQLVAYVVVTETFDREEVQAWLRSHLPAYMVPGIFIPLDRLPLTTNG
ncbi:amino acid adenylation domain-containing protein, partial [Chitinophaga sp. S165]|uniref:non-ribosomal peptide synthetase n=1 Tax=Chitinophaga sp. S165 TaxID=2135462 RepID=UPI000D9EBA27